MFHIGLQLIRNKEGQKYGINFGFSIKVQGQLEIGKLEIKKFQSSGFVSNNFPISNFSNSLVQLKPHVFDRSANSEMLLFIVGFVL